MRKLVKGVLMGLGAIFALLFTIGLVVSIFSSQENESSPDSTVATVPEPGTTDTKAREARLSPRDTLTVAKVNRAFSRTVLNSGRYRETLRGVDDLIALCREDPNAIYQVLDDDPGLTMRQVVEDGANTLRRFQPDLSSKLETVADNGCR